MNNNKKHIVDKSGMKETPKPELTNNSSNFNETLLKIFFIIGLYVSFLFSGIYEEKLYKGNYYNEDKKLKFQHPLLAIFINSFISFIVSNIVLFTM